VAIAFVFRIDRVQVQAGVLPLHTPDGALPLPYQTRCYVLVTRQYA